MKAEAHDAQPAVVRTGRGLYGVAFFFLLVSAIPLLLVVNAWTQGDVLLYYGVGEDIKRGTIPYRDRALEYPPYAIPIFLAPWSFWRELGSYQFGFALMAVLADSLLKCLLLLEGARQRGRIAGLLPLALFCVAVPFIRYIYLQRYDIFPALLTLGAVCCFARGWYGWAGAVLAVAAGVKVYPALLGPVLWVLAIRRGHGARFAIGAGVALLPLAALSFFLPWWRFLVFHGERGLQVESLYASVVWLAHLSGLTEAQWTFVKAWFEVKAPLATAMVPWAKLLMLSTTLGSVGFTCWAAGRVSVSALNIYQIARLALVPLLAFVGFNLVLSPQYMIWLLPLAALGILGGTKWPMIAIAICTAAVPIFYPSPQYGSGLNLSQTLVLLGRNVTLVVVWVALIIEFCRMGRKGGGEVPITPAPLPST